ncbi:MAG TPA: hypothetical protein PK629_05315 [Oscillospiraceae bacterium]|nr:hypothetical protein [Oscillospiraceae bacterium]HPK35754.1 hypothetical protein [Oscillospiraceae bacterium]HPR75038.1 hypothetical protein [Oscillospiraceae bacterium]
MDLPIKAFCLNGDNAKIELIITEILDFPNTSIEGGYDVKGILNINIGCYFVRYDNFIFATGVIYRFLEGLEKCYQDLKGEAEYRHLYERDLEFTLEMTSLGHAVINGTFRENPAVSTKLDFEMSTDQTFIKSAINDIKNVIKGFGGYTGLQGQ